MNEKEYVKVTFADKQFYFRLTEPSQPERLLKASGPEAREILKQLNKLINTRPRSEDDRHSLERGEQE